MLENLIAISNRLVLLSVECDVAIFAEKLARTNKNYNSEKEVYGILNCGLTKKEKRLVNFIAYRNDIDLPEWEIQDNSIYGSEFIVEVKGDNIKIVREEKTSTGTKLYGQLIVETASAKI